MISDLPRRGLAFEAFAAALIVLITLTAHGRSPWRDAGPLGPARAAVLERVSLVFDPPVSFWVAGLLLGDDSGFPERWKRVFRETGTAHLTAVSGYNLLLVLASVRVGLARLPLGKWGKLAVAASAIVAFVFLTGRPSSVLRAAFMLAAVEAGRLFGRPVQPLRALLLAVLVGVLLDPAALARDRGFQLSALATFGLAAFGPPLREDVFARLPGPFAEWASQSVAATIAVAPLLLSFGAGFPLVGVLANVLVAAFIPPIMALGAALTLFGFVWSGGAAFLGSLVAPFVALPLVLLRLLAAIPFASVSGPPAVLLVAAIEVAMLAFVLRWRKRVGTRYFL